MATLTVPSGAITYKGVLNALPSIQRVDQRANGEPDRYVPFSIDWATEGGTGNAVLIDLSNGGVQPISQIAALWVDNSGSNVDVQFLFIQSQQRYTVPARASELVPVATGDIRFYIVAPGAGSGDQTFAAMFNYMPPPVAIAETEFTAATAVTSVDLTIAGVSNYQLVPAGVNGSVRGLELNFVGVGGAGTSTVIWNLQDGNTVQIADGRFLMRTGVNYDFTKVFNLSGLAAPFHNGLVLSVNVSGSAAGAGSTMFGNVYRN